MVGFKWTVRAIAAMLSPFALSSMVLLRSRIRSETKIDWLPDLTNLRQPRIVFITFGACFIELAFFIPVTYLPSYAIANGHSSEDAYRLLTFLNIGSLIGRLLPGYLGDNLGRFNTQIGALISCLIAVLTLWLPSNGDSAMTMAFAIIFGVASGSNISLTPVCIAQLCQTEEYGRYYSCVYSIASFGSLIGVPMAGSLIQAADGKFWGLMLFAASSYTASILCFVIARVLSTGLALRTRF
jgi:predicted MFS family arabinose efflux permease